MSNKPVVVVKVGTSTLLSDGVLAISSMARLVEVVTKLQQQGFSVVLVSSGAVGSGCQRFPHHKVKPKSTSEKQAMAAIGQVRLMQQYADLFSALGGLCAQILLTAENFQVEDQYNNCLSTLRELFALDVVPIVNENDTVAVAEIEVGDNDTLAAFVGKMVKAEWLFLLTDVDALYTANPREDKNAEAIHYVSSMDELEARDVQIGEEGSSFGTGGMVTKIHAANISGIHGVTTVITNGKNPENILRIIGGERIGTRFLPQSLGSAVDDMMPWDPSSFKNLKFDPENYKHSLDGNFAVLKKQKNGFHTQTNDVRSISASLASKTPFKYSYGRNLLTMRMKKASLFGSGSRMFSTCVKLVR